MRFEVTTVNPKPETKTAPQMNPGEMAVITDQLDSNSDLLGMHLICTYSRMGGKSGKSWTTLEDSRRYWDNWIPSFEIRPIAIGETITLVRRS